MRIFFKKESFILVVSLLVTVAASAQQGIGTDTPDKSSVLELKSSRRGLLLPRIALEATNQQSPIKHTPKNSLLVYNTNTTSGTYGVTPGYYYWSETEKLWMRIINQKDVDDAIAKIKDTKVTDAQLTETTLTIKQNNEEADITVDLANLVKNYTADETTIQLVGSTFKRGSLTGDVTANVGSTETKVVQIQGKPISTTNPTSGQVLKWDGSEWAPTSPATDYKLGDAIPTGEFFWPDNVEEHKKPIMRKVIEVVFNDATYAEVTNIPENAVFIKIQLMDKVTRKLVLASAEFKPNSGNDFFVDDHSKDFFVAKYGEMSVTLNGAYTMILEYYVPN